MDQGPSTQNEDIPMSELHSNPQHQEQNLGVKEKSERRWFNSDNSMRIMNTLGLEWRKDPNCNNEMELSSMEKSTKTVKLRNLLIFQIARDPLDRHPKTIRGKIHLAFEEPSSSIIARVINVYFILLILISVIIYCIQTLPSISSVPRQDTIFFWMETALVINFIAEYVIRVSCCPKIIPFVLSPESLIDLVAILPYFIELIIEAYNIEPLIADVPIIGVIRLVRIFRLFKLGRNSSQLRLVSSAMKRSKSGIFFLIFILSLATMFFASLVYYAEVAFCDFDFEQELWIYQNSTSSPGTPTPFQNIPISMWWSLVTISTVGYGDHYPITLLGKCVGGCIIVSGLLVIAYPVALIGVNLKDVYEDEKFMKEIRRLQLSQENELEKKKERKRLREEEEKRRREFEENNIAYEEKRDGLELLYDVSHKSTHLEKKLAQFDIQFATFLGVQERISDLVSVLKESATVIESYEEQ